MDFLSWLNSREYIREVETIETRTWETGFYYKLRLTIKDDSMLQASEYRDEQVRNYAFHWQDADKTLRVRWDNAPHHSHIATYPHHKHTPEGIFESWEMTLESVLEQVDQFLRTRSP